MLPQVINVNRAFTKLTINHLRSSEAVSSVFRRQCEGHLNTWSALYNRERSDERIADSDGKSAVASVAEPSNVLYERGLIEEKKSKAMRSYLERAQKYNAFMTRQREEYHNGKRHLANMMGADPNTFTQEDVDAAIEYLFPSGLFVPAARPFMKPPENVFPPKKDAEFDDSGRPFHFLFYTGKPNFFQLLHDFGVHLSNLNSYEDKMIRKNLSPDPNVKIELTGSVWIKKEDLEMQMVEVITDKEYDGFIRLLERIVNHPYVYNIKNEIMKMRTPLMDVSMDFSKPPKPNYDNSGRAFVTTEACPRKSARATVTVRYPGTGKIEINGEDITYFDEVQSREQILFPLHFSNMQNQVDVEATVSKGGTTGQAGAIRYGIAWGLRSFVDEDTIERMRLAGLLTRDFRTRERKKPGQWKARRKYTWKKR